MTVASGEYKSVVGLDKVYVALVTQDDASGYVADVPEIFAPAVDASAEPETSQEVQYADNQAFDVLSSEGVTKITLSTTNIPMSILAKYLGKVFDTVSGRMFDQGGGATPPDAALSFRAMKSNGSYKYFQYLKGKFSVPKDEAATKADKAEPKPASIVFTAMNTIYEFDLGDIDGTVKRIVGDEDSTNFSGTTWFSAVQTPSIAAPDAIALSSSTPTAGATGVSKTAAFTLTFNNALMEDAIDGINLLDATPALVTTAATLDATKKIMTITHTALAGTIAHTLVYAVEDIYGQNLNGILKFTTAA